MTEYQYYLLTMSQAVTGGIAVCCYDKTTTERESAAATLGALDGVTSRAAAGGKTAMTREELRCQVDRLCSAGTSSSGAGATDPLAERAKVTDGNKS